MPVDRYSKDVRRYEDIQQEKDTNCEGALLCDDTLCLDTSICDLFDKALCPYRFASGRGNKEKVG